MQKNFIRWNHWEPNVLLIDPDSNNSLGNIPLPRQEQRRNTRYLKQSGNIKVSQTARKDQISKTVGNNDI